MNVCFQYNFHPVGQGLFASGSLYEANAPQPRFVWVYDCGCLPTQPPIDWNAKIFELYRLTRGKRSIDLLTLSHFDDDHIAGVTALLGRFRVETLVLPYVPLWERLLIPFAKGIGPGDARMEYFLNPITYLRNIGGENLGRIIVVEPGEEDGPFVEPEGLPREPDLGDRPWKLKAKTKHTNAGETSAEDFGNASPQTESLPSGQPLTVEGLWEYCPYNAKRRDAQTPDFKALVEGLRDRLMKPVIAGDTSGDAKRQIDLAGLKKAYDVEYGSNARQRNIISLFLYAGPVYPTWQEHKLLSPLEIANWAYPARYPCYYRVHPHAPGHTQKCSILYTGDGYLNTVKSFNSLNSSLGVNRMSKLGVVQVAHHGARGNWHEGLAGKLDPAFSVFSSDPARGNTYHPHAEVLRDFWPYSPIQVNQEGASYCGWLLR
jgi:hypothetical protein